MKRQHARLGHTSVTLLYRDVMYLRCPPAPRGAAHVGVPAALDVAHLITLTFVRGGGEVVFKNTYESLSVDGRCVPITERTSLT